MGNLECNNKFSIVVSQLGARRHYAVPRLLQQNNLLGHFYTDICAAKHWPVLLRYIPTSLLPNGLRRLKGRIPYGIPTSKITAFTLFGYMYADKRRKARSIEELTQINLWAGDLFNKLILKKGFQKGEIVYGFNSASEQILRSACSQKIPGIVEQTIAPFSIAQKLLDREIESFPDWGEKKNNKFAEKFISREHNEWSLASRIITGSEFVKEAIAAAGGPAHKCKIVPYGVDPSKFLTLKKNHSHRKKLHILFIGEVGLRKGIPYLLSAMKTLLKYPVSCRIVGGSQISIDKMSKMVPSNVEIVGAVPRMTIYKEFQWADLLCLPSLCEGSAMVTYEALAAGLPVITTPNSGSIVRNNQEGFIVPIRNSQAIADCIAKFCFNRKLLKDMSYSARYRSSFGSLEAYGKRLSKAVKDYHLKNHINS